MDTDDRRDPSGFNRFFGEGEGREGHFGRVYAAYELPEVDDEDVVHPESADEVVRELIELECVLAAWADGAAGDRFWVDAPLSVVVLDEDVVKKWLPPDGRPGEIAWFELHVRPVAPTEANATQFVQLLDDGERVFAGIERFCGVGPAGRPFSGAPWLSQGRSTHTESAALRSATTARRLEGVLVLDVGQGASQALVMSEESHLVPAMYVDVGGGVLMNKRTFPKGFRGFCTAGSPPVILSHWDWDHWSSVGRFPQLASLEWIAPPPPEKPIQQALAWMLEARHVLHIWSPSMPGTYVTDNLIMERGTGRTTNDSGISVTVVGGHRKSKHVLLPGDCGYRHIPSVMRGASLDGLCVTHHGGRLHSKTIPAPKRKAKIACSVGAGNSYKHPFWETYEAHTSNGWPTPVPTGFFGPRPSHVFLPWTGDVKVVKGLCPFSAESCSVAVPLPVPLTSVAARKVRAKSKVPKAVAQATS